MLHALSPPTLLSAHKVASVCTNALPTARRLGNSGLSVSSLCLGAYAFWTLAIHTGTTRLAYRAGTMFFGAATQQEQAFRLLDVAAEGGINCLDTAEMYPVPQSSEQQGRSEVVLGKWLQRQNRCAAWPIDDRQCR